MKRRNFLTSSATLGLAAAVARPLAALSATEGNARPSSVADKARRSKLAPPEKGSIPVAFAISQGVTVIDFAGPWEVFQDVDLKDRDGFNFTRCPTTPRRFKAPLARRSSPITASKMLLRRKSWSFRHNPVPKNCTSGCAR